VVNITICKLGLVVAMVVEPNNSIDANLVENLNILTWMMAIPVLVIPFIYGPHKCNKFVRNNPIQISVFHSLVKLILFHIEFLELVPAQFYGPFQTL